MLPPGRARLATMPPATITSWPCPRCVATEVETKSPKGQPLEGSSPSGGWAGVSGAAELLLTAIHGRALSGQFRLSQSLELLRCSDEPSQASRWRGVLSRCWTDVGYQVQTARSRDRSRPHGLSRRRCRSGRRQYRHHGRRHCQHRYHQHYHYRCPHRCRHRLQHRRPLLRLLRHPHRARGPRLPSGRSSPERARTFGILSCRTASLRPPTISLPPEARCPSADGQTDLRAIIGEHWPYQYGTPAKIASHLRSTPWGHPRCCVRIPQLGRSYDHLIRPLQERRRDRQVVRLGDLKSPRRPDRRNTRPGDTDR